MEENNKKDINVLIVDDHQLFAEGLELILLSMDCNYNFHEIFKAPNGKIALEKLRASQIDLMILDLNMPLMDGLELMALLKKSQEFPTLKILVVTGYPDDKFTRSSLKSGADGILLKVSNINQLKNALTEVLMGNLFMGEGLRTSPLRVNAIKNKQINQFHIKERLTKRELEVLIRVSKGNSNRIIASELFISPETVSAHRKNIIKKLKLKNTADLIKFAIDYNLI